MEQTLLKITGKVQGVWYRGSAQDKARELGIKGYAKNMPDGSVEVLAQGEAGSIRQFVDWCKQGPAHAEVNEIKERELNNEKFYENFDIY